MYIRDGARLPCSILFPVCVHIETSRAKMYRVSLYTHLVYVYNYWHKVRLALAATK